MNPANAATPASSSTCTNTGVPTFTPDVPSATKTCANTPSSCASHSIVALSVSISANTSPAEITSPTAFFQLTNVPSAIVGDNAGIVITSCCGNARDDPDDPDDTDPDDTDPAAPPTAAPSPAPSATESPPGYPALIASTSPASSASTATGTPTATPWLPSPTKILANHPSSCASHSIVALSVSTSQYTSPGCTASPSFFFHATIFPCDIVGDNAGIRNSS